MPRLTSLTDRFRSELETAKATEAIEAGQPQAAAQTYQKIVDDTVIYKPVVDYQKQFGTELSQIGADLSPNLNYDSVMALPHVYDWAVEAVARSRLGLSRLAWARSDWKGAEGQAERAIELLNKRANSPLLRARVEIVAYELLRQYYAKKVMTGRERLAELNRDLLKDYLDSPAARRDEAADQSQLQQDQATMTTVDSFTASANGQRTQAMLDAMAQAAGTMSAAMGTIQQTQINSAMVRSGGRVTPQIRQMQQTKQATDFQRRVLSADPSFAAGVRAFQGASPFSNMTVGQQMISPDYGANAPQLIKSFVSSLIGAGGGGALKQAAELVNGSVDGVVQARGGKPEVLAEALARFTDSFGSFQSQAEGVTAGPQ